MTKTTTIKTLFKTEAEEMGKEPQHSFGKFLKLSLSTTLA